MKKEETIGELIVRLKKMTAKLSDDTLQLALEIIKTEQEHRKKK